jgi:threonine aldolase
LGSSVEPVETNILIFHWQLTAVIRFDRKIKAKNISISSMGHGKLRIVTHLDWEVMHTYVLETLAKLTM